ncbi:hypothetical protein NQZ68_038616, partial [Dissostichus eleginoides]
QSLNDKRRKNLFSRKFPFYKSKEASEAETSDVDREYLASHRSALVQKWAWLHLNWVGKTIDVRGGRRLRDRKRGRLRDRKRGRLRDRK